MNYARKTREHYHITPPAGSGPKWCGIGFPCSSVALVISKAESRDAVVNQSVVSARFFPAQILNYKGLLNNVYYDEQSIYLLPKPKQPVRYGSRSAGLPSLPGRKRSGRNSIGSEYISGSWRINLERALLSPPGIQKTGDRYTRCSV
jgi:hypothetical protein